MTQLILSGETPKQGDHGMVVITEGTHKGRVGFYEDDDWADDEGGKALVYIGPKLKNAATPMTHRYMHAIRRKHLLVPEDRPTRATLEAAMRPHEVGPSAMRSADKLKRFSNLIEKYGGSVDFESDLKLVESALKAYTEESQP